MINKSANNVIVVIGNALIVFYTPFTLFTVFYLN